jgi:hypothetical protein
MKGFALAVSAFSLILFSITSQAQTVYHIDRVVGPGTVTGTITVNDDAIPGQIGPEDIISWWFETNDNLSDPPPAHGPIAISSTGVGGMEGNAWLYLSATETELLFDFEGAFNDPNVFGIGFNDGGAGFSVTYGFAGFENGKLEQLVHFFDDPVLGSQSHYVEAVQTAIAPVVIGTTESVPVTRAELPRRFEALDLSSIVNSDLGGTAFGTIFPAPGPTMFGDVPFSMTDGGNGNTWIIEGLRFASDQFSNPPAVYSISGLNIDGAIAMYAQINSAFGVCGFQVGSIGVSGISNLDFTLIEGKNIRDWFGYDFCSQQTDAIYTANFDFPGGDGIPAGDARLDVYAFDLSGLLGPIDEFRFENFGNFFFFGAPFLSAVTFEIKGYDYELLDYPGTANTQVFGINDKREVVGNGLGSPAGFPFVYSPRQDLVEDIAGATDFLDTIVLDISNKGEMAGIVTETLGEPFPGVPALRSGFIRDRDGNFEFFGRSDVESGAVCQTMPRGLNTRGLVSGFYRLCDWSLPAGFIYDPDAQTFTDIVPSNSTIAQGINAAGDVVGRAIFSDNEDPCNSPGANHYGWLRTEDGSVTYFQVNGQRTDARGINDDGYIVGFFLDPASGYRRGFRVKLVGDSSCETVTVEEDEILHFPGYNDTFPQRISNAGVVVGTVRDGTGRHGFIARPK